MSKEIHSDIRSIFKSDMETAEKMTETFDKYNDGDISNAAVDVAEELLSNVQKGDREKYIYATLFQIGQSTGDEQLQEYAGEKLRGWVSSHE